MFRYNNKDTRTTFDVRRSRVLIVNSEHIAQFFEHISRHASIVGFKQVNVFWVKH